MIDENEQVLGVEIDPEDLSARKMKERKKGFECCRRIFGIFVLALILSPMIVWWLNWFKSQNF